jgi:hypothetical protein
MKNIVLCLCDKCEKMIPPSPHPNPPNGFVVEGNIYVAEPFEGGLVGDNFPKGSEWPPAEDIRRSEIRKVCYCKECFLEVLHLTPRKEEVEDDATLW